MVKLTERQLREIHRKIATAEHKIAEAMGNMDRITVQLKEYGLDTVEAVYHPSDGIVFQDESDGMTDFNSLEDYIRHFNEENP